MSIKLKHILLLTYVLVKSQCYVLNIPLGKIHGSMKVSHGGRAFLAFEGIPYAKPPLDARRFEEPEPVESWDGILEARTPTECCQIDMLNVTVISGQEDCLHLNVYVPREKPDINDNLNILVYIHGGSFLYGSGHKSANPLYIMDKDIILVTLNYRLGIFGFLSTEDDVVPGNNGLKDQVLALKWVQNNIASFGGNSSSITLMGLSAGGASVHLHYFSDMSKGLFHQGFSQSGVALNPWAMQKEPLTKAKILATSLNCPSSPTVTMVECLKGKTFREILAKESLFFGYKFIPYTPFAPVVEKGSKPFLKEDPYRLLLRGQVLDVPWLVSNTAHEGMFPTGILLEDLERINREWDQLAPILLDYNFTLDTSKWTVSSQKIKEFYLGVKNEFTQENPLQLANIFSDRLLLTGIELAMRMQANVNKSPIYHFYFSYPGDDNVSKTVAHGDDKKYFFGTYQNVKPLTINELKMKDMMLDMLVAFITNNKPTIPGVLWKPTSHKAMHYVNISSFKVINIKSQTADELAPTDFWKYLGFQENVYLTARKDEL